MAWYCVNCICSSVTQLAVCLQTEINYHILRPGQTGMFSGWRRMSSLLFSSASPVAHNVS